MSRQAPRTARLIQGTIRRRLLVNALVDPDEAAAHLPQGLRPHITDGGTVIGTCLLDIVAIRPAPLPAALGSRLRAAAHRISVEWTDDFGETTIGVYVPIRHTDSRIATLVGGRLFPGAHAPAVVELADDGTRLDWSVVPRDATSPFAVRVRAAVRESTAVEPCEPIGGTCIAATIGVSPDRHGRLEAAHMAPEHRRVLPVVIEGIESAFISSFSTAVPAASYLMRDVEVRWTPASAPQSSANAVPA